MRMNCNISLLAAVAVAVAIATAPSASAAPSEQPCFDTVGSTTCQAPGNVQIFSSHHALPAVSPTPTTRSGVGWDMTRGGRRWGITRSGMVLGMTRGGMVFRIHAVLASRRSKAAAIERLAAFHEAQANPATMK
jgi:hypothetical protein